MVPGSALVHDLFTAIGVLVAAWVFVLQIRYRRRATGRAVDDRIWTVVAGALVGGALLGRLGTWAQHFNLRANAGLVEQWLYGNRSILSGLVGAYFGALLAKRLTGYRDKTGDLFAPAVAAGMAVGRIGCLLTELPGTPTGFAWGMTAWDGVPRHPSFAYEIAFHTLAFLILLRLRPRLLPAPLPLGADSAVGAALHTTTPSAAIESTAIPAPAARDDAPVGPPFADGAAPATVAVTVSHPHSPDTPAASPSLGVVGESHLAAVVPDGEDSAESRSPASATTTAATTATGPVAAAIADTASADTAAGAAAAAGPLTTAAAAAAGPPAGATADDDAAAGRPLAAAANTARRVGPNWTIRTARIAGSHNGNPPAESADQPASLVEQRTSAPARRGLADGAALSDEDSSRPSPRESVPGGPVAADRLSVAESGLGSGSGVGGSGEGSGVWAAGDVSSGSPGPQQGYVRFEWAPSRYPEGILFNGFVVAYGVFRFAVEFVRGNEVVFAGLTRPQWFLLGVAPLVVWRVARRLRKTRKGVA